MQYSVRRSLVCFVLAVLLQVITAQQSHSAAQGAICDRAAHRAAQDSNVPLGILLSIARVETGRSVDGEFGPWPWSINLAGKGYFFDTAAQAMEFAQDQIANGNANFDVGCFQINLRWHSKNFTSLESAFDPQTNANYAARFLTQLYESEGDWAAAVAAYHSRTPDLADKYLRNVKLAWQNMVKRPPDLEPPPAQITVRQNSYPLLRAGQIGMAGSLMPRSDSATMLIGQN